jgi:nitrogen fixation protein FixH
MPTSLPKQSHEEDSGFRLTGRHVFLILCGFFGIVFATNFTMARLALSTFRGEVTARPYEEGLRFNNAIEAARAQAARGWSVDGRLSRAADGAAQLELSVRDAQGKPVQGLTVDALLEAPADRKGDRALATADLGEGRYLARGQAHGGQWELVLSATQNGARVYQSRNRVQLP